MSAALYSFTPSPRFQALYAKFTPEPEYLNGVQTAAILGISTMSLNRLRFGYDVKDKQGNVRKTIPPVADFPRPYRFAGPASNPLWKRSELEAWAQSRREAA